MPGLQPDTALPPPDFAIVGARKCGTTALYSYLATHPGIAMSARKEPCFWSSDLDAGWGLRTREAYDAMWAEARPSALRGEASPVYLQSQVAVRDLLAARPDVRLVAMIRNPLEMVASRHANMLVDRDETVDLETAWRLQERRLRGEALPPRCPFPEVFQYRAYAAIGDHLERFFELVPAGQRVVVVLDDLRLDPRREYLRVLALLGLADDGRTEFRPVREASALHWPSARDFQLWASRRMTWLYQPARSIAHAVGFSPAGLNRHRARRAPLRAAFEQELIGEFLPQIEKVERLLDRDLAAWKAPKVR